MSWCGRVCKAALFASLAVLLLFCSSAAMAQTFRGTILGTVTDSTGASIAGAAVAVKNVNTGLSRTVTTSEDGTYSVPELPIGTYTVTVERAGFKQGVVSGIQVEVSSERRADVTLQPGEVSQRIEVTGDELPQVESTSNVLGGIVESKVVTNLPVNGRDYQKLIFLVPGVAGAPDEISDSPGSYGTFSVNGARGRSNNFLLDGTDMNDGYRNDPAINEAGVFGTPATILPVEAIAEMRIASNFEAEYGRSAGAVINIVTKSGTNSWHGTGFDFLRNTVMDARNFFNTVPNAKQPFHDNQFGGALGGALKKDKTFFFADYEGVREVGSQSSQACVPTAADYAANTPPGGINPVIQNLINAGKVWPTPTTNVDCYAGAGSTNTTLATPFSNRVDSAIIKLDHSFNANNLLTGRYYIGDSLQSFPLALSGGGLVAGYNTVTPTRVQLVSISYVSTITPSITNEARLGWNRFAEGFFPEDRSFDPSAASIGLDTVGANTPNADSPYNFGLPAITISNASFPQLGADKGDPRHRVDSNWHYIDSISWKAGRHDIKFGYEYRRTSVSQIFNRDYRGRLQFSTLEAFLAGTADTGGSHNSQYTGDSNRNTFQNSFAGYVQDSLHLNRRLTLNLGLRYDYFGIVQEKNGLFTNVDPTTGNVSAVANGRLYQPDYNNWAPRVSVAWDVTGKGKTVLRAGYGIFYDAVSQDMFLGHLPYSTNYAPGAAYSGLPGIGQITTGEATGAPFTPGVPVYGAFSPVPDEFGVDPKIRSPYIQNYNLNLQQELTKHSVLQIAYVGSGGRKLFDFRDINQPTAASIQNQDYFNNGCCVPGSLIPGINGRNYIYWQESAAKSSYNSMQVSWRINGWHGLTSSLNYTWSHSIDNASDGEDYVPNAAQPTDSTNLNSNRGNSNFDVRNRLTWNFIYEFPNFGGSLQKLKNGWGINGIVTAQSGQPFHLIWTFDDYDGSFTFFPKPDVVGPIKYNYSDPTQFLDLTSFAVPCTFDGVGNFASDCVDVVPGTTTPCPAVGPNCVNSMHFGNEGRNSLRGPNFRQFDFSIFKNTSITERVKLELRLEGYNLLNHPNFASPLYPGFLANADFNGIGLNGRGIGSYPLTVTGDVGIGYPFLGGGGPRSLQVAAKISF